MDWIKKVKDLWVNAKNMEALVEMEAHGIDVFSLKERQRRLDNEQARHKYRGTKYTEKSSSAALKESGDICAEALSLLPE